MEPGARFWEIFFEVYDELPRQGPGSRACTARALGLCGELPPSPAILDLGCGSGAQTLHLAGLTSGSIVAVDSHAPGIERLKKKSQERGLTHRVRALAADMSRLDLPPRSFDLIWSEGALYNIGIDKALRIAHGLLRPGGRLAFTDAVWRRDNPPAEVRESFDLDYPAMGRAEDIEASLVRRGFEQLGRFTLPEEAWWDDFYAPMLDRIEHLRGRHSADAEALGILDQLAREPAMHRRYSDCYAYEFFIARRRKAGE